MSKVQIIKKVSEIPNQDGEVIRLDKNDNAYKQCGFAYLAVQYEDVPGYGKVQVHQEVREIRVNLYEHSYLDQREHFGFSLPVGTLCYGDVVTREVAPYNVPDRRKNASEGSEITVNTFTTVVFGRTDKPEAFEAAVRRAFKSKGHDLLAVPTPENKEMSLEEQLSQGLLRA